jgi:hypothetical protein
MILCQLETECMGEMIECERWNERFYNEAVVTFYIKLELRKNNVTLFSIVNVYAKNGE